MTLRRVMTITVALALVLVVGIPAYGWANGVRFYAVDSGSMAPAIGTGALAVDLPTTPTTTFRVGDIVTFHPTPGYTTTHRIVAIGASGISTRGDANPTNDLGFIQPDMIVGRVAFSVPFGGYAAAFFREPAGVAALLLVLCAVYIAWHVSAVREPTASSGVDAPPSTPDAAGGEPG